MEVVGAGGDSSNSTWQAQDGGNGGGYNGGNAKGEGTSIKTYGGTQNSGGSTSGSFNGNTYPGLIGGKFYGGGGGGYQIQGKSGNGTTFAGGASVSGTAGGSAGGGGGGGSGYYGGPGSSAYSGGGGGGSGFINTSKLTNAYMYGYGIATSNEPATKTYSTSNVSVTPTSEYAKSENGYARITRLD